MSRAELGPIRADEVAERRLPDTGPDRVTASSFRASSTAANVHAMADQSVPQGPAGSPTRRSEPHTAAASGEARAQPPTDGVPELIEGVAVDRQSRRYAHTLRRSEQSAPVRMPEASSSLDTLDDQFDIATTTKPKPPRPAEPAPAPEPANRPSAPSESTALYRKRTNPTMPAMSHDVLTRSAPAAAPDAPAADALMPPHEDEAVADDGVSRLPSVVLDPIGSGAVIYPLALRRPPIGLVVAILLAALIVISVWLLL